MKSQVILIAFSVFVLTVQDLITDPVCGSDPGTSRDVKISLKSVRNETGHWMDSITARTETKDSSDRIDFNVTHRVIECGGKRVDYIQGVSISNPEEFSDANEKKINELTFHPRFGMNVAVLDNERTVQKIRLRNGTHSAVFTNRPLEDDEIFQVEVKEKNEENPNSISIGVITRSPDAIDISPEMLESPFAQLYVYNDIYSNGTKMYSAYGKSIHELQVGERVGVMRNRLGTLHFFVNGVDQGPAVFNISSPVYGILELRGSVSKATIVDASSSVSP